MAHFELNTLSPLLEDLQKTKNIFAILCYGSFAEGSVDEKSDVDLLVIAEDIPKPSLRQKIYSLSTTQDLILNKSFGTWGVPAFAPVNDELIFLEKKIELAYNTTTWVENAVEEITSKGLSQLSDFPFRAYTFLGLLDNALSLFEKDNYFTTLRRKLYPFPQKLKKAIIAENLPLFLENFSDLKEIAERNVGVLAFEFYLFRAIDALIQLLFAINEVYDPASKRIEKHLWALSKIPESLPHLINDLLPIFFTQKQEIILCLQETELFLQENISFLH
jgi:predicted nucleotidyltransferase